MASHDGYVQAAGALLIFLILDVQLFDELDHLEVPMVHRVVETIEALRIQRVHLLSHRTLHEHLYDV